MNIESQVREEPPQAATELLVVDDDALITATLASALRQAGYLVSEATTPAHALALCEERAFQLAILDERMPAMRGTELARQLRNQHDLPVVFLSAYHDAALIAATTDVGALGFFLKPVDPQRILPALQNILARAQELRTLRARENQLQTALANEREINTAIGILMERLQISREEAFDAMRRYARSQRQQMVKIAGELLRPLDATHRLVAAIAAHRVSTRSDTRISIKNKSDERE